MSEHTKEPWHTGGDGTIIYDNEGWGVANATVFHSRHNGPEEAKGNARRIVACVNACAGIRTEALEERAHMLKAYDDTLEAIQKERDELLAEVEALRKDKIRLDAIEANCWDVRYTSSPNADAGDCSIGIEIVGHSWENRASALSVRTTART